jgi:integrase
MVIRLPITKQLADCLAATPVIGATSFLVTKHGNPYSVKGFGNYMREWCDEAGLREFSSHGIRHAIGCRLAEAGATVDEIMAVLGHTDPRMAMHYTRQANKARLADSAFARLVK